MIELVHVSKRYGETAVVEDLSLAIERGEFFVLIGPSGSGKSTTLRMINRLVAPSGGSISLGGEDIERTSPEALRRRIGYVIQSIGLFPHWTVARNVATVPELLGWPRERTDARVRELLVLLGLEPEAFAAKYPHQLSGGEQQRVGVARALAARPEVLLMDEPFGALDPIAREALQTEVARIQRDSGTTVVFVTHDMGEALKLASRIAILERGRLVQAGTPLELLANPANDFVRQFVGHDEPGIRLLAAESVASRMRLGEAAPGEAVPASQNLRQALSEMISRRADRLAVADASGAHIGALHLSDLVKR